MKGAIISKSWPILPFSKGEIRLSEVFSKQPNLQALLQELETCMEQCGEWSTGQPSAQAMMSTEPFCIDTMSFAQWLRYVMIARFNVLLDSGAPLPTRCHVAPMAEEAFKHKSPLEVSWLVACLEAIDTHLSEFK